MLAWSFWQSYCLIVDRRSETIDGRSSTITMGVGGKQENFGDEKQRTRKVSLLLDNNCVVLFFSIKNLTNMVKWYIGYKTYFGAACYMPQNYFKVLEKHGNIKLLFG